MVSKISQSKTEYYQQYYLRNKDRYKYLYYSKKLADEERKEFFSKWGGERNYYKIKYKEFMDLCNK